MDQLSLAMKNVGNKYTDNELKEMIPPKLQHGPLNSAKVIKTNFISLQRFFLRNCTIEDYHEDESDNNEIDWEEIIADNEIEMEMGDEESDYEDNASHQESSVATPKKKKNPVEKETSKSIAEKEKERKKRESPI